VESWVYASSADKKLFRFISSICGHNDDLLKFLFDSRNPNLRLPVDSLLKTASGFCSTDYLLIKLSIDIWCEQGSFNFHQLFNFEPEIFKRILLALTEHHLT